MGLAPSRNLCGESTMLHGPTALRLLANAYKNRGVTYVIPDTAEIRELGDLTSAKLIDAEWAEPRPGISGVTYSLTRDGAALMHVVEQLILSADGLGDDRSDALQGVAHEVRKLWALSRSRT